MNPNLRTKQANPDVPLGTSLGVPVASGDVCMYVCVWIRVYAIYMYMAYTHLCMYACMHACMYVGVCICVYVFMYAYVMCMYVYIWRVYIYVCEYVCLCVCIRLFWQSQGPTSSSVPAFMCLGVYLIRFSARISCLCANITKCANITNVCILSYYFFGFSKP